MPRRIDDQHGRGSAGACQPGENKERDKAIFIPATNFFGKVAGMVRNVTDVWRMAWLVSWYPGPTRTFFRTRRSKKTEIMDGGHSHRFDVFPSSYIQVLVPIQFQTKENSFRPDVVPFRVCHQRQDDRACTELAIYSGPTLKYLQS